MRLRRRWRPGGRANVAKRSIALNSAPPLPQTVGLRALGQMAAHAVREAVQAYRNKDADAAIRVRDEDARLDAQYTALFRELLTYMMEDPRNITPCTHLLFMAKNLAPVQEDPIADDDMSRFNPVRATYDDLYAKAWGVKNGLDD
ncbi:phosphate uptake regulator PhoU [Dickeya chrysanthemi]|uniref:phosphate signaling complex PhoU family protein n=1 Tax=Dickeya chrysanthemi TaxID=556 RepID=UPI0025A17E50|nr:phosphate uptake regulator PhoU [Dickeya chrysanthemi]WJM85495.1 phosphate uptake regulator PhoU [Dickeya chrysanthemi]